MRGHWVVPSFILVTGCASGPTSSARLEARVRALEAELAELRATVNARATERHEGSVDAVRRATDAMHAATTNCKDVSIPSGTEINIPVAFDLGRTTTHGGDQITITDIRGTRGEFAVGGIYLVRGEYTLASADEAILGFGVGAVDVADACTFGNTRGRQRVTRGSGKFELATTFVHRGYPGISFFAAGVDGSGGRLVGAGSGGVQFGKGEFLQR
jgi:outer membrane murein-binding lipoprotein Lpp